MALAYPAGCTARKRPRKERGRAFDGAHTASNWCVIAPSSATATRPCNIKSAVAIPGRDDSGEQYFATKRFRRARSVACQGEFRLLTRFDIHQDVIVLLFRRLSFPVEVRWIVGRHFDAGSPGKDRVLFCSSAAQQQ